MVEIKERSRITLVSSSLLNSVIYSRDYLWHLCASLVVLLSLGEIAPVPLVASIHVKSLPIGSFYNFSSKDFTISCEVNQHGF